MPKRLYVDSSLLEKYIDRSGLRKGFISDALGISREGFSKKRKGIITFTKAEMFTLCSLLNIGEDREKIFTPKVEIKENAREPKETRG